MTIYHIYTKEERGGRTIYHTYTKEERGGGDNIIHAQTEVRGCAAQLTHQIMEVKLLGFLVDVIRRDKPLHLPSLERGLVDRWSVGIAQSHNFYIWLTYMFSTKPLKSCRHITGPIWQLHPTHIVSQGTPLVIHITCKNGTTPVHDSCRWRFPLKIANGIIIHYWHTHWWHAEGGGEGIGLGIDCTLACHLI